MVVVSHLFSFLQKVSGGGVIRTNHTSPCLELPISRQPHYTQAPLILFTLYDCGYRIPLLFDSWISIICERVIRLFSGPVRTYIFSATFISTSFYHMSHKKAILIFRIFCNFKGLLAKNGPNQGKYRLFWSDLWSKFSENPEGFSVWLQCEKER